MIHDDMERSGIRFAEVQLRWRTTRKLELPNSVCEMSNVLQTTIHIV